MMDEEQARPVDPQELAEQDKVDIRLHSIIYELQDEVKKAIYGMLEPVFREVQQGRAEVRNTFRIPKVGMVAGCYVQDGLIKRDSEVRLLRDNVVVFKGKVASLRRFKEDVAEGSYTVPLGKARVARPGTQCTVLTYGAMVPVAVEAADKAAERGWSIEVLDLRTLVPLDSEAVLASVQKTGRAVILHEAPRTCGYGAELSALIAERALTSLQAPVLRVTGYDTPFPYTLEHTYLPDAPRVERALEHVMAY